MKLKDAEKRLKNEPNNLGLRVQVAGLMREAGRSIEAVELYRSVALAYRDQGRTQQAIAVCKSILEIAPEDSACQGLLAMLQAKAIMPAAPPARPSRPSRPPANASRPPANEPVKRPIVADPVKPPPQSVVMRGSPMPPAPEVPSLRSPTSAPATRSPTSPPGTKPIAVGQRPLTPTRPPSRGMEAAEQPTRDRPPTRPQVPMPAKPAGDAARTQPMPLKPPAQHDQRVSDPGRRSSFDATPLPPPMPYHQADRTSQPTKVSMRDLDSDATRVDPNPGLAQAARRISGLISELEEGVPNEMDLAAELETRQRPRIASDELNKIAAPPPTTTPIDRLDEIIDDLTTPPPADYDTLATDRRRALTPHPRGSDDAITTPPERTSTPSNPTITSTSERNLPRVGPPQRTSSRPPAVVSIPPKT
ncbi:MAG TPA: hypothetical protein VFV99_26305, partial [Kofleriaceae bacterium]|nr:hypothetical protein [Kofleriaceae bacterium]